MAAVLPHLAEYVPQKAEHVPQTAELLPSMTHYEFDLMQGSASQAIEMAILSVAGLMMNKTQNAHKFGRKMPFVF